jgi:hypothetical protein
LDQSLRKPADIEELHKNAAQTALSWANMIALPPESVDATLMSIHVDGDELVIACSGDGVIILESRSGILDVHAISSPSGYPFYPSYLHQPDRLAQLVHDDRCTKTFKLNAADYKYAAIASDGMTSFYSKGVGPVSLPDVLKEFWTFKNSHGAFVERRMKRFKKDTQPKGWQHADDLAIGVIHLGDEHVRQGSQNLLAS